jgi:drug/metabolite transporter (DMT)-like permease
LKSKAIALTIGRPSYAAPTMPAVAFGFALTAAFLHALWNLLLARTRDPESATAIAMVASVVVFAPVTAIVWKADGGVWPFIVVTSFLQLLYFVMLAAAYARAQLSVVYPIARGVAPVLVLVVGVVALGAGASARQAAGVCLVGLGVMLVRGLRGHADLAGTGFGLAIAVTIAAYTLVDKHGIEHAGPITYLELGMLPASIGYATVLLVRRGPAPLRAALRPLPVLAGVTSFGAYVLVLAALSRASAASVAAVRETSVVIATAAAAPLLREPVGRARLVGAAVVVGGVALVSLG